MLVSIIIGIAWFTLRNGRVVFQIIWVLISFYFPLCSNKHFIPDNKYSNLQKLPAFIIHKIWTRLTSSNLNLKCQRFHHTKVLIQLIWWCYLNVWLFLITSVSWGCITRTDLGLTRLPLIYSLPLVLCVMWCVILLKHYWFLPLGPLGPKGYCDPLRAPPSPPPPHTLFWLLHQHGAAD